MTRLQQCPCGSGEFPEAVHDGYGIFLFYSCQKCHKRKLNGFRADIFERYVTEEQIEDDY